MPVRRINIKYDLINEAPQPAKRRTPLRNPAIYLPSLLLCCFGFYLAWPTISDYRNPLADLSRCPLSVKIDERNLAPELSPEVLMATREPSSSRTLPKYLHQSWRTTDPPEGCLQRWSYALRLVYSTFEYLLWSAEAQEDLVRRFYPHYLAKYLAFPADQHRTDFARYLYLHQFGGIYSDLDVEMLKPLPEVMELLRESSRATASVKDVILLGSMGTNPTWDQSIPNSFIVSTPGVSLLPVCTKERC